MRVFRTGVLLGVLVLAGPVPGAELFTLSPADYEAAAPPGRKAKAIYGDYVLRNDRVTAVVGDPTLHCGRSAGRNYYPSPHGRVLDFALRDEPNDLLDLFDAACCGSQLRPQGLPRPDNGAAASKQEDFRDEAKAHLEPGRAPVADKRVTLRIPFNSPVLEVRYILEDGWPYLLVETDYKVGAGGAAALMPGSLIQMSAKKMTPDGPLTSGRIDAENLAWIYDRFGGQAYGVQALGGALAIEPSPMREAGLWLRVKPAGGGGASAAGSPLTVRHRLYAGRDVFAIRAAAAAAAGGSLTPVRLEAQAPDGPVAGAEVTAVRDGVFYAAGRTRDDGALTCELPAGQYDFTVAAFGRPAVTLAVDPAAARDYKAACEPAAWVAVSVADGDGKPLPCKIRVNGLNGTPDPVLGPDTGERLVRNLIYTENGNSRQALPPGDYAFTVSRGPEYAIATVPLTLRRGAEAPLRVTLQRVVETPGWLAMNGANFTAGSGTACDVSPKGRILNLLAEGLEFAPSTDIETITDLAPAVKELGAQAWLATCPGVRLNWSGKYAQRIHTSFPLVYRRGKQDGGMLQRTQHVMTKSWLERWNPAGPKVVILDEPWSDRIFLEDLDGDHKPDALAGAGNEVLDVHDLRPLAGPVAEGQDTRVLDWLAALRLGYLAKGIVNSGDLQAFHGNARWRTYVRSETDEPGRADPAGLAASLGRGNTIMTSGPFLDVTLRVPGTGEKAGPGDRLKSPDGRVEASVSVRAPDWMQIDEVRILVNGEAAPALCFTRAARPDLFKAAPAVFDLTMPLALATDAFVVVTAAGTGVNLAPREGSAERNVQVAVANRIWVDAGGDGYRPSPPVFGNYRVILGGEKNVGAMWEIKPVSAKPGAGPGLLQMPIQNRTNETVNGSFSFTVRPEGAVRFFGGEPRLFRAREARYQAKPAEVDAIRMVNNRLDYTLKPNQKMIVEFEAALAEGRHPGGFYLSVPRDEARSVSMVGYYFEVYGYTCPVLKAAPGLEQVSDVLKDLPEYSVTTPSGGRLGEARFAVTRDRLVLDVAVAELGASTGAVVRVYTTRNTKEAAEPYDPMYRLPRKLVICETTLTPDPAGGKGRAVVSLAPEAAVPVKTARTEAGCRLQALLPLAGLGIPQAGEGKLFLIEIEIESVGKDGVRRTGTVFGSTRPRTDNMMYGSINGNQVRVGEH